MNIYAARKLQQALYKRANSPNKYQVCTTMDGGLYYHNVTRLSDSTGMTIDTDFINAISDTVEKDDLKTTIFYNPGTYRNWPPGMYLAEIIKID